ncbi:hypothetical protein G8E10_16810 [Rhizobiaceae bacterium CRRU44]|uniref:Uncharacterized protein n=1 Tax=Ferranicluibacter rubi TaxID=2715133 RepID=A0AA44CDC9_9HYPH|nr:hypothetical protein [Ferranicluibacter rubi]NHT77376.1 hypothetical protein [Ferranicluibacter rubi]
MRDQLLILALTGRNNTRPHGKRKIDVFADPLDDTTWDGLRWLVPLLAALTRHPSRSSKPARRPRPIRLYTRSPLRSR